MSMKPTIGRRVWYWPHQSETLWQHDQPLDAGIVHVHGDGTVNLDIVDEMGRPLSSPTHNGMTTGYRLTEYAGKAPGFASWMPYQEKVQGMPTVKAVDAGA
jgi:hypothetical protein